MTREHDRRTEAAERGVIMTAKTHSKNLSLDITNVNGRMNKFTRRMAEGDFADLNEAVTTAQKIAHTCKAKVIVRGRKGNLHYMCDGNC